MKKKGLIISTIVMVVVLIASLTTATYAWFSTSSVTSIQGFSVEVASTNDVNIGFKFNEPGFVSGTVTTASFVSGATTYNAGTAGQVGGYWTKGSGGINGLSNDLKHDIAWGSQTKAIGFQHSADAISVLSTDPATYTETVGLGLSKVVSEQVGYANYSINAARYNDQQTALTEVTAAKANKNATANGDYVYMLLGVQPTKAIPVNTLVVMLDLTDSDLSTVGIVGSIHLAYRTSANGATPSAWTDVDIMGANEYGTQVSELATNVTDGASGQPAYAKAYKDTYNAGTGSVPAASYAAFITGLTTDPTHIDQIEMILYMDGHDGDCINAGLGASCAIKLFFCTANVA